MSAAAPAQTLQEAVDTAARAATGRRGSQTVQTRRCIAAMRWLGIPRSDFSATTSYNRRTGEYGSALCSPHSTAASQVIAEHAMELAEAGFTVHLIEGSAAFFGSGNRPSVHRLAKDGTHTHEFPKNRDEHGELIER